jgi:hypothetical protein
MVKLCGREMGFNGISISLQFFFLFRNLWASVQNVM